MNQKYLVPSEVITLRFSRRGCIPEEPDEGKPQVRFGEGAHSNLGANTLIGGGL